jgi:AcrR family transcriptional regulator
MPRISDVARQERKQQLIEAAWRCAGRMGYSQLTVDDVCAEAEVSKGAFYGYFSSKQDLLIALLEEDAVELDGLLDNLSQRNLSNVDRLRSFAREMCERGSDQARVQVRSDLWAAILTEPLIRERMVSAVGRRRAVLRGWIEVAVSEGEIAEIPANAFASVLLALGDGLTLHGSLDPSGFRWNNIARVLAVIFAGLSGDEE